MAYLDTSALVVYYCPGHLSERAHYNMAFNWLAQFAIPLRTLDVLHLAVAAGKNLEAMIKSSLIQ